jgi:hypothetical protein
MSWVVSRQGSPGRVKEVASKDFDDRAAQYAGQEEQTDVLAAKERALSALDNLKIDEFGNGVSVDCSGSRSEFFTNIRIDVKRIHLDL